MYVSLKSGPHKLRTEAIEKLLREHQLEIVCPLYTMGAAVESLDYFNGVPYELPVTIGRDLTCTFYEAGHILGSAMSVLQHRKGSHGIQPGYPVPHCSRRVRNVRRRVLKESNLRIKKIVLVHGEEEQSLAFADYLRQEGFDVVVPYHGQSVAV